ncbi:MAG TPA: L-threonylcarbamoyladenylate synthase [Blastocatellia bacterium]|jgi:L-threonylcarbamoyladenylate synthase
MTIVIQVRPDRPQEEIIERAAAIIRGSGLVAFPTETVYGLGADAMNESAVQKIFEAKGRPADNPLIVHVGGKRDVERVADEISEMAWDLIERFWPGPLTLVLKRRPDVARSVSAGLPTVAVRMPGNVVALGLIRKAGTPIAAPSANLSGRPSPTSAAHVARDLDGRIDMILDGGATDIGIESTVLDMTTDSPAILRPGWITEECLSGIIALHGRAAAPEELRRSPGTRHRHYSPRARVILVEQRAPRSIERLLKTYLDQGPVGLIGHTPVDVDDPRLYAVIVGGGASDYARSIYAALRELDERNPSVILVEGINERGEGRAVMDRLRRAASEIISGD